jgi:hypothetical protein
VTTLVQKRFWNLQSTGDKMATNRVVDSRETNGAAERNDVTAVPIKRKIPKKAVPKKQGTKKPQTAKRKVNRRRGPKPYPVVPIQDVLTLAEAIQKHGAGGPVRRLRLMELMNLSPTAKSTRDLITNSGKYGLTTGHHGAEELSVTERGKRIVDPASSPREKRQAEFDLAISAIEPFKLLYDEYAGRPMPSLEVMQDKLVDLNEGDRKPCVDIFVGNAKFVGLLKTIGGVQHLLKIEDALDELARTTLGEDIATGDLHVVGDKKYAAQGKVDFAQTCFFIAPIGDKKSDDAVQKKQRQHSDTILNQYVKRALEEQKLNVVRADEIEEAGMISKQVIDYILHSRLVIADLSYSNPNVFYELCLRHVTGLPTVHVIKQGDKIPFDVGNFRTISIALDDVHEAIAQIDTHRAEIANYVRTALEAGHSRENPILTFYPKARFQIGAEG